MAHAASRKGLIRGAERKSSDERNTRQNSDGAANATRGRLGINQVKVSSHDILLRLPGRQSGARAGRLSLLNTGVNPGKAHEFAINPVSRGAFKASVKQPSSGVRPGAKGQAARRLALAKTTASAIQDKIMVVPPSGAAKGKMRSPVKT
jgi:hypothetical protein